MVGTSPVGNGHRCRTRIDCQVPDCDEEGIFHVQAAIGEVATSEEPTGFSCQTHIGERAILATRSPSSRWRPPHHA